VIEVRDLHTYRGINYVLQGVSLRIGDGACTVLLGRNGMGKTTLVHSIMGMIRPGNGTITLDDEELVGKAAGSSPRSPSRRTSPLPRAGHTPMTPGPLNASTSCSRTSPPAPATGVASCPVASSRCWRSAGLC
jgi:energy-coupling factor transporter ATP-binding protein EcfA2